MGAPNETKLSANSNVVQYKLVADDAAEAVKTIKSKFGDAAKVVSVKQKDSGGLTGFLKKPRLEIIVEVPRSEQPETKAPEKAESPLRKPVSKPEEPEQTREPKAAPEPDAVPKPISDLYSKNESSASGGDYFSNIESRMDDKGEARLGSAANPVRRGTLEHVERAASMLRSVGFDDLMIERIRYELDFRKMGTVPNMEIYSRICDWLRKQFPDTKPALKGDCRAFIGGSGVGKTSALSKALSADVFVNGLEPSVLKIDGSVPNASDGLEAFCEIMGAPLYRSLDEIEERSAERPVYVDVPGFNLADSRAVDRFSESLDEVGADERVLVVNAAYETEVIAETLLAGSRLGATHVVFTHLDETRKAGKLWKYVLGKTALPLFFSHGPNPAGDYTMNPFSYLLEKTFPQGRELASASRRSPLGEPVKSSKSKEMASA